MKQLFLIISLFVFKNINAQKPCEFSTDVKDSLGTYKSTKDYLMYEHNFGSKKDYIYFSLINTDGMPSLNVQFINKDSGFVKAKCLNSKSKIYLQLNNGKIITLIHEEKDDCGTMLMDDKKNNVRVLSGVFLFPKGSIEELKTSPISFIRIKFSIDTEDYVMSKSLISEMDSKTYSPNNYFIDYIDCVR